MVKDCYDGGGNQYILPSIRCIGIKGCSVVSLFQTLHFFNTPPMIGENEMRDVFAEAEAPRPKAIKFFQSKSKGLVRYILLYVTTSYMN